jgi:type I restriction enzyme, S subunit
MWEYIPFENCLEKTKIKFKLPKKDYRESGKYPIVSQEESLISGYHDDISYIFKVVKPVVVFGDHTLALKYIDFDFIVGADGVKILQPKETINPKYFYYVLKALMPKTTGYARHYKLLKKLDIPVPSLAEQERIVAKLDAAFAELDEAIEHAQLKARNASNLYDGFLDNALETNKKVPLIEACDRITDGSHYSPKTLSNEFPYITVKDISDDKIDFNNCKFVSKSFYQELVQNNCNPSMGDVLFSKDGTVGKVSLIDYEKDFVVLSSLAIISPNKDIINPRFLYYSLKSKSFINEAIGKKTGAAIRRIILKTLKNIKISIPELDEQHRLISVLDKFTMEHEKLNSSLKLKVLNLHQLKSSILNQTLSIETKGYAA